MTKQTTESLRRRLELQEQIAMPFLATYRAVHGVAMPIKRLCQLLNVSYSTARRIRRRLDNAAYDALSRSEGAHQ